MNAPLTDTQAFRTTDKGLEVVLASFARELEEKARLAIERADDYKVQLDQRWELVKELENEVQTSKPLEAVKFIKNLKERIKELEAMNGH